MSVDLELAPKHKRPAGEPCCEPVVYPDVEREQALRMAEVAKALGDPIRLQLVDVLRKHAGKVCVCELVPLFDVVPADALAPPQEAARGRDRRLRAPGPVGLLLRPSRRTEGADLMAELTDTEIRETVRERYAAAASAVAESQGCGCGTRRESPAAAAPTTLTTDATGEQVFGEALYDRGEVEGVPAGRRRRPRSAAACPRRSPTCTRARPCSTSARAPAPTC